ncbi:T6SS effector BTH_I2691 family protein [Pseudomonas sp. 18175]|uniref:T6SS effector BTH_I2691 family protein n=1 Tax=Pseudomonas sp. 18175 TaxID=3390056 RepID=UPI003D1A4D30
MSNPIINASRNSMVPCRPGKCNFCNKQGLLIFPLRHSAFCSDSPMLLDKVAVVALGESFDFPQVRFSARMLRKSYLYVLVERNGLKTWQSYFVTDDARLYQFAPLYPPAPSLTFSCSRDANAPSTSAVSIEKPEEVKDTYWLYTPDSLSEAKLEEYEQSAAAFSNEGKMQHFSPADWVNGNRHQQFSLESQALAQWVLEYKALGITATAETQDASPTQLAARSPALLNALNQQAYPPLCPSGALDSGRLTSSYLRLVALRDALERDQGAALVLRDAIGVTQELNAWRNAALEGAEHWLNEEQDGATNHWRVQVALRLKDVREGIREHRIKKADESIDDWAHDSYTEENLQGAVPDKNKAEREAYVQRVLRQRSLRMTELELIPEEVKIREEAERLYPDTGAEARESMRGAAKAAKRRQMGEEEIERRKKRAGEQALKLFDQLDMNEVDAVLAQFDAKTAECEAIAEARAADHLTVLQSAYLLNAWYAYDPKDLRRGWAFAIQAALCTLGMEACPPGQALLTRWWEDTQIAEGNLFWRGYALNQQDLIEDTRGGLTESKSLFASLPLKDIAAKAIKEIKRGKSIINTFEKANKVLADGEKLAPMDWLARSQMGVLMGWYAQLAKGVFTYGSPNSVDKAMAHVLTTAVSWRLGNYAPQLRLEELAEAKTPKSIDRVRSELQVRVRASVQAELDAGKMGNFYAVRIGVIVGLYEAFQLYNKAQAMPDGNKQKAEFAAAALATTAVALDLMHTGAEWTSKKYGAATATGRIAASWGGGLKLYGGFLGAIGGVIGGSLDVNTAVDHIHKKRFSLAFAYAVKGAATFGVAFLSLGIAISGSGPYLRMLIAKTGNAITLELLKILEAVAVRLAAERALLLMRAGLARLAWVVLVIGGVIWLFEPTAIEAWCEKSVFRKSKNTKGFKGQAEEIVGLESSFISMVGK